MQRRDRPVQLVGVLAVVVAGGIAPLVPVYGGPLGPMPAWARAADLTYGLRVVAGLATCGLAAAVGCWAAPRGDRRIVGGALAAVAALVLAAAPHTRGERPAGGGFPPVPHAETELYRTRSGLAVHVPKSPTRQCWDAPLPCMPRQTPELRLRRPGEPSAGFAWGDVGELAGARARLR